MHNLENNILCDMVMQKEFQNMHSEIKTLVGVSTFQLHVTVIRSFIVWYNKGGEVNSC
jgi:ribose 5-phosphate isomerase